ncbi:hypothetical protein BCE75_11266 [Isoptericola sp. CG 20/1183]|uniref:Phosphodiesterase n=1 Tax=Isoptericola halotolerans TaxID=300560 RepID=A0ABX5EAH5_9MICO|nr:MULTISPECIES: DUF5998 family protein [Isoptericola]MCK0115643.1 DUF5998 family protein [Isoptericola sp. S6320L]PRZ03847.1 hypothetical protein BCE75_11266 [Isoptericola sp. CG 20/1183]PRZ04020.1 hypothetical protein BCL65_11154 [Isoptericola halotolerans]
MPSATTRKNLRDDLTAHVFRAGYYPDLVNDVIDVAIADEPVLAHLVQAETTFDSQVRRHLTVLVLTPTRLVAAHVDDHEGDAANPSSAAATTEAVPLGEVRSVALTHVVAEPADHRPGDSAAELTLAVGWGAVSRLDLEPAQCPDPSCDADHGYTGQITPDDIVVRVSDAAEGRDAVRRAAAFARELSAATGVGGRAAR